MFPAERQERDRPGLLIHDVESAVRVIRGGGLLGLPTETVYGLAADAEDPAAVARVFAAKGRPADHPLIVHLAGAEQFAYWTTGAPGYAKRLAERCWPGPLTLVVPRSARAGDQVTGGQPTVGLRCPDHPLALAVLGAFGGGLAAPSANRFGRVSPTRPADVLAELAGVLRPGRDAVLDGGPCAIGVESTIVDCTGEQPRILRPGAISSAEVASIAGVEVAATPVAATPVAATPVAATPVAATQPGQTQPGQTQPGQTQPGQTQPGEMQPGETTRPSQPVPGTGRGEAGAVRAPGTLAAHYAPRARVLLAKAADLAELGTDSAAPPTTGLLALAPIPTPAGMVRLSAPDDPEQYAATLYRALREADALNLTRVLAVPPPAAGIGVAIIDRLARAAAAHR